MKKKLILLFMISYFWIITGMFVLAGSYFAFRENVAFWRSFFLWIWVVLFLVSNILWWTIFIKLMITIRKKQKNTKEKVKINAEQIKTS